MSVLRRLGEGVAGYSIAAVGTGLSAYFFDGTFSQISEGNGDLGDFMGAFSSPVFGGLSFLAGFGLAAKALEKGGPVGILGGGLTVASLATLEGASLTFDESLYAPLREGIPDAYNWVMS